jgi:hypothetical protein
MEANQRFGHWTVIGPCPRDTRKVICRCDCGTERSVQSRALRVGTSKSCGGCPEFRAAAAERVRARHATRIA